MESLFFQLELYGLPNIIPSLSLSVFLVLLSVNIAFTIIKKRFDNNQLTIDKLFIYSIAFYVLTALVEMAFPFFTATDERHLDHLEQHLASLGLFHMVSSLSNIIAYWLVLFFTVFKLNRMDQFSK